MTLTAIYKDHSSQEFSATSVIGSSFRKEGKRPVSFVVPNGLTDNELDYLDKYITALVIFR